MVRIKEVSCGIKVDSQHGNWTVLGVPFSAGDGNYNYRVVAQCQCGAIRVVQCRNLAQGTSERCRSCNSAAQSFKHGDAMSKGEKASRLYRIWSGMKDRCNNPNANRRYHHGRGITVCDAWINSYEAFRDWSLANGYADTLVLDRYPDKDGPYAPSNVRWTTVTENNRNMRSNVNVTAFGETKCINEWADDPRCVVSASTLGRRVHGGMSPELAITIRFRKPKGS